jgi:NADH-quinone oxidoreductase subunit N
MSWQTVATAMLPEHLLLAGICVLVALESAPGRPRGAFAVSMIAVTAAAAAAVWLFAVGYVAQPFAGQFSVDPVASLGKAIVLVLAMLVLLISRGELAQRAFPVLLLSSLYGVCLLLSSDTFLTLFLDSS